MQGDLTDQVLDGRYLLQERLGAGGMGEVWRCRDQRIGRDVAVKLLLDLRLNTEMEARFEREARVAGGLSSPLIVTLHDYGHGDLAGRDVPYLVMELLQGRTLAQIRNDERNSRRVLTWGAQVCAALEVAHRAGVVHRDIKPGNVMITDDGGLKVLDFGIARVVEEGHTRGGLTADGTVIGTADYMAPEQAAGQPADTRSDLYSFGCLLYFLITARPPFTADTFFGMLQKQLNETPVPPSTLRPGLPPELDGLILALLAKDPAARPPSAQVVREALEAMLPAGSLAASAGAAAVGASTEPAAPTATGEPSGEGPTKPDVVSDRTTAISSAAPISAPAPAPQFAQSIPAPVPHVPMQPPTHPPTQVGPADPTHVVPAEFGGRGTGATEEAPKKSEPRVSRRKVLFGFGGLAGVAVAGGGAYAALGGNTKKDGGTAKVAAGESPTSASAPSASGATTAATSAATSDADAAVTSSSSSSAAESAASPPSGSPTATGSQPPLAPGGAPVGKIELAGQPNVVFQFIDGGKHLIVSDDANGVQIFDIGNVQAASKVTNVPTPLADGRLQPMLAMDYSPARSLLALGGSGGLYLFDLKDPAKPVQLSARGDVNGKKVNYLGFNGDGTKLVIATDESGTYSDDPVGNCVMDVTDPRTPAQLSSLTPPKRDALSAVAFAAGDKYIVSSGQGGDSSTRMFQLWDAGDLRNVRPVDSTAADSSTKYGGALYVATGGPWHTLVLGLVSADSKSEDMQFLDFSKPQTPVRQWKFPNTSAAVGFHPTRPVAAIGDSRSGAATVYDLTDPNHPLPMTQLAQDPGFVQSLAFSPDGSLLAMALKRDGSGQNDNGVIYFWKM